MPVEHQIALENIAKPIFENGKFDFSKKEKAFYFFVAPILTAYASLEANRFYLKIGGDGTKYLPIGNFSKEFGAWCAFGCNFTFAWYYMMDTIFAFREAYIHFRYARELGISTSRKTIIAKTVVASTLSLASGVIFSLVAGDDYGKYNQIETGAVNTFLNYLGALALQMVVLFILKKVKDTAYRLICIKAGLEDESLLDDDEDIDELDNLLNNKTKYLKKLKNDDSQWQSLKKFSDYVKFIQASDQNSPLIQRPKTQTKLTWSELWNESMRPLLTLRNFGQFMIHTLFQAADKISLYGWWQDTMSDLQNEPFKFNKPTASGVGTGIFLPFVGLSSKVTYDTVEEMEDILISGYQDTNEFIQNPDWSKETWISIAGKTITGSLTAIGYFFAYISANSGLDLNAKHGWNQWWNVGPTSGGTTIYNGFGFFKIFLFFHDIVMSRLLHSPEKREILHKNSQVSAFFKNYPNAINELAKQEMLGLNVIVEGDSSGESNPSDESGSYYLIN